MNRLEILFLLMKRKFPNKDYEFYAQQITSVFDIKVTARELRIMEEPSVLEEILDKKIHSEILW